jgi:uncharacterized membrane protein YagU involved in acid resistance
MSDLMLLAYHHSYGYGGGYGYHHSFGGGMTDWMAHMALSAVIHAMIYSVIFRLMHQLTLGQGVVLVVVVLALLFMLSRSRDRRGW